ncbi:alcohol oxidase [Coniophora puteana RWD-64-598 SS2]|uniref:Alcohol oxidase n=1 Tax=Coniophora puteana (strain RWD-64-598) TaxID=741705 RepID=A0A5M3N4J6_CONPW|nr:alcohol oxidase [Coniophora puteana RWD-64-598 SS2]EIW85831.1 alcohol oxidase [Coniophora puteana RWD-64-598 SS2]
MTPQRYTDVDHFLRQTFDFVIVGGGTAGLALAARLSENSAWTIGVLEAGPDLSDDPNINAPGKCLTLMYNPRYDWMFASVPQPHASNRVVIQPRGKGLGGCSAINFLGMTRPSRVEMDFVEKLGNPGWNWESFMHYSKQSETLALHDKDLAERYFSRAEINLHGSNGPIQKLFPPSCDFTFLPFCQSLRNLGVQPNYEASHGVTVGFQTVISCIDTSGPTPTRSYAASAYLLPNSGRRNLFVLAGAQVSKIQLEDGPGGSKRAVGVEFYFNDQLKKLDRIRKEVIISAGSFQTPQILELSGIGNPNIISKHGIGTMVDLPGVGENLQDHICVHTIVEVDTPPLKEPAVDAMNAAPEKGFAYLPASQFATEDELEKWCQSCENSISNLGTRSRGDIGSSGRTAIRIDQLRAHQAWLRNPKEACAELIYAPTWHPNELLQPTMGTYYNSVAVVLSHPMSRGSVHIASADPLAHPRIDTQYFSEPADLEMLVCALEYMLRVYRTSPLADNVVKNVMPDANTIQGGREKLAEYVKEHVQCVFHPVGTASMGPRERGGVVDSELRVYGTENLRVVDLSVMPMEVSCHTQSIAYAIAEKVSGFRWICFLCAGATSRRQT